MDQPIKNITKKHKSFQIIELEYNLLKIEFEKLTFDYRVWSLQIKATSHILKLKYIKSGRKIICTHFSLCSIVEYKSIIGC